MKQGMAERAVFPTNINHLRQFTHPGSVPDCRNREPAHVSNLHEGIWIALCANRFGRAWITRLREAGQGARTEWEL